LHSGAAKECPQCGEVKPISDFKDKSLVTGIGRFCLKCKTHMSRREYVPTFNWKGVELKSESPKSDINKLLNFSEHPEKYATGTDSANEKLSYLESIKHKFNEEQLTTYTAARKRFDLALALKKEAMVQKVDHSAMLVEAFKNHRSIKIRYKGSWRMIDPYSLNNTYVVAYCHLARDIRTFRVDRIQDVELLESFNFNKFLQTTAESKLVEAPKYKGYQRY